MICLASLIDLSPWLIDWAGGKLTRVWCLAGDAGLVANEFHRDAERDAATVGKPCYAFLYQGDRQDQGPRLHGSVDMCLNSNLLAWGYDAGKGSAFPFYG